MRVEHHLGAQALGRHVVDHRHPVGTADAAGALLDQGPAGGLRDLIGELRDLLVVHFVGQGQGQGRDHGLLAVDLAHAGREHRRLLGEGEAVRHVEVERVLRVVHAPAVGRGTLVVGRFGAGAGLAAGRALAARQEVDRRASAAHQDEGDDDPERGVAPGPRCSGRRSGSVGRRRVGRPGGRGRRIRGAGSGRDVRGPGPGRDIRGPRRRRGDVERTGRRRRGVQRARRRVRRAGGARDRVLQGQHLAAHGLHRGRTGVAALGHAAHDEAGHAVRDHRNRGGAGRAGWAGRGCAC